MKQLPYKVNIRVYNNEILNKIVKHDEYLRAYAQEMQDKHLVNGYELMAKALARTINCGHLKPKSDYQKFTYTVNEIAKLIVIGK